MPIVHVTTGLLRACSSAASVFLLILWITTPSLAQQPEPTPSDFIRMANRIATHSSEIPGIWPGFWSEKEPFLFMRYDDIVHVYNLPTRPEGDFEVLRSDELAPVLRGKAYRKQSYLPEYREKKFSYPGQYDVGGTTIYALEPKGGSDFNKIDFFLHEAFHYYQRSHWSETPGDTVKITFNSTVLDSLAQADNPEFIGLLNYERSLLADALAWSEVGKIRQAAKRIIVARSIRSKLLPPKASDVIDRYERREGSATYLGLHASALANDYPADSVHTSLSAELRQPLTEFSAFPVKEQRYLRWPHYATGAAIGILLDRLDITNWKAKLAGGATFYHLLESGVPVADVEFERIKTDIMNSL